MTALELADEVDRRGLCRKRDGSSVEINEVNARTNNYGSLFEKQGASIRLKKGVTVVTKPTANWELFKDDDNGFFAWLVANPGGMFINAEREPKPNYLVLHKSWCRHFKRRGNLKWTKDYVKVCSVELKALERWAAETVGGQITPCSACFGS